MLTTSTLRLLGERDLIDVFDLLAHDPVAHVFVESRVRACAGRTWRLGGELWGYVDNGRLRSLCYSGANVVPVLADELAIRAFADRLQRQGRRCSSIVGEAEQVRALWQQLEPAWGPGRDVRIDQPLLAIDHDPRNQPDPLVRRVRPDEIDILLPACIAMFTEEVGVSPLAHDGGSMYRARVSELIASGRAFARIEDGQVVFKAEVGAVTPAACQVQGVWVEPSRRGTWLSAPGMAAVVALARASLAPSVSLYVNEFNEAARRSYERVGFRQVGTFATVLF